MATMLQIKGADFSFNSVDMYTTEEKKALIQEQASKMFSVHDTWVTGEGQTMEYAYNTLRCVAAIPEADALVNFKVPMTDQYKSKIGTYPGAPMFVPRGCKSLTFGAFEGYGYGIQVADLKGNVKTLQSWSANNREVTYDLSTYSNEDLLVIVGLSQSNVEVPSGGLSISAEY